MNMLSRSFAGIDFHRLKKIVELQQLLGSAFSANSVVDALWLQKIFTHRMSSIQLVDKGWVEALSLCLGTWPKRL